VLDAQNNALYTTLGILLHCVLDVFACNLCLFLKLLLHVFMLTTNFTFQYLKELICYLDEWRETVEGRIGFDDDQKQCMLLSAAMDNGIRITGMCASDDTIGLICMFYYSQVISGTGTNPSTH